MSNGIPTGEQDTANLELIVNKDASNGYVGLTALKINFKNVLNTFTSFLTNSNTASRTYTFPDKDLTVAGISDIPYDGWISLGTCTYEGADSPTFTFSIASDVTGIIAVRQRIKLTQTTVKYFIIHAVGAYTAGKTIITIYGGTDYSLANAAIISPYYSLSDTPFGFNPDPAKWTVTLNDVTARTQASPVANTVYNLGSLSISMPIGSWDVQAMMSGYSVANASTSALDFNCGLSTSASSFSNANLKGKHQLNGALNGNALVNTITLVGKVSVTSKTTYYVVASTTASTVSSIGLVNNQSPLNVYLRSAYL